MNLFKLTAVTAFLSLVALVPACGDNLHPAGDDVDDGDAGGDGDAIGGDGDGATADASGSDGRSPDATTDATTDAMAGAPTVIATVPAAAAVGVAVSPHVQATFSRPMNPATLTALTFTLRQGAVPIAGTVTYAGSTATFTPTVALTNSLLYTATITTGAADPQGQALAANHVWTFTTGACTQAAVDLRSARDFAVLASQTVTSTGPTMITGDLGVSPGDAVTGFPPGILSGALHAGDPTAAQAKADARLAYIDTAGRTLCATTVAGNLGSRTLAPGLYKSTSSLEISSGDLTLDAGGDSDAVFIFQMTSTLTTTAGRQVILAGGARGANVTWLVSASATLGTGTAFHGTIIADQAITLGTGATLDGRALALTAAVALDSNPIVRPTP